MKGADKERKKGLWWKIPVGIFAALVGLIVIFVLSLGCNTRGISFLANAVNNGVKLGNHICIRLTGQTMTYLTTGEQAEIYDFENYEIPKGYTGTHVRFENCDAYQMSKKEGGDHSKAIYHLHGGGYIGGISENDMKTALKYSQLFDDADTFSLQYRTAPENLYPCALEDAVEGYEWLLSKGYKGEDILVCGDSAGGGLALAMTLYLRDHDKELPQMLCLASPWADFTATGNSYKENILTDAIFGSLNTEDAVQYPVPITYAGGGDLTNPYISPVFGDYTDMPPMLIQAGDTELLLSDSQQVADKAKKAGVDAECVVYEGMMHTFYVLLPDCREGKEAWNRIAEFISKYK